MSFFIFLVDESENGIDGVDVSNGYGDCYCNKFNDDNTVFHYEEYQKMKPKNVSVFREQVSRSIVSFS